MAIMQTVDEQLARIATGNRQYTYNKNQWRYLLESYMGGDDYKRGQHLTRYQMESDAEYAARVDSTPLENHCRAIVTVYNSYLFRQSPDRDFNTLALQPDVCAFVKNADLDDRDLDGFMKDVATQTSIFGHAWVMVVKPNVGAVTRADEIAAGVRPYVALLSPLTVLDWHWERSNTGYYDLRRLKYVEEINGSVQTIKEWTPDTITTWNVDFDNRLIINETVEPNGLGKIPAICAYNVRSQVRGLGISDISDIADLQKYIYNLSSECEQTIRMDSHPSLVKTPETQASTGAGSIISMPENMDPGLKPYLLEFNGASVTSIHTAIQHATDIIDVLSNTGSVRATSAKILSGIALETEFQLLNARLAEKANNLELVEKKIWELFCEYQGYAFDIDVEYADSYSIQDEQAEYIKLQTAKTAASSPLAQAYIDSKLIQLLCEDLEDDEYSEMDEACEDPSVILQSLLAAQGIPNPFADAPGQTQPAEITSSPAGESLLPDVIPANNQDPVSQRIRLAPGRSGPGVVKPLKRNKSQEVSNTASSDMITQTAPRVTPPNAQ